MSGSHGSRSHPKADPGQEKGARFPDLSCSGLDQKFSGDFKDTVGAQVEEGKGGAGGTRVEDAHFNSFLAEISSKPKPPVAAKPEPTAPPGGRLGHALRLPCAYAAARGEGG